MKDEVKLAALRASQQDERSLAIWLVTANAAGLVFTTGAFVDLVPAVHMSAPPVSLWLFLVGLIFAYLARACVVSAHMYELYEFFGEGTFRDDNVPSDPKERRLKLKNTLSASSITSIVAAASFLIAIVISIMAVRTA